MRVLQAGADCPASGKHDSAKLRRQQWAATLLGLWTLAEGTVAAFMSANVAGSTAFLADALPLFVLLGDRLAWLKLGGLESQLREAVHQRTQQVADLKVRSGKGAADRLREEAERLLLHSTQQSTPVRRFAAADRHVAGDRRSEQDRDPMLWSTPGRSTHRHRLAEQPLSALGT